MSHFFIRKSNKQFTTERRAFQKTEHPQILNLLFEELLIRESVHGHSNDGLLPSRSFHPPKRDFCWSLIQRQISWDNAIRGYTQYVLDRSAAQTLTSPPAHINLHGRTDAHALHHEQHILHHLAKSIWLSRNHHLHTLENDEATRSSENHQGC